MNIKEGILFKKKKETIKKEGFDLMNLMNEYDTSNDELLKDYSEAINRTDEANPLKNKNIKIELDPAGSNPINEFGYVNNVGVLRPYMDKVDYRSTTWGKNGCPTFLSTTNVPKTAVKLNKNNLFEIETDPKLINIIFPMIPGQACGFEGENIYVNNIGDLDDYTTEYQGSYSASVPNVDDNSTSYNFDLCKTRAIDTGMRYFGLNNYNTSMTNSECVVSNDMSDFNQSIMSGNIVYTSSSVTSLVDTQPTQPILIIYIFGAEVRLCKIINDAWTLTQILVTYNTQETDECYNNGTFNVNDIQATWGGNCNSQGYNVQPNNVISYILNNYNNQMNNSIFKIIPIPRIYYQIGTDGLGTNIGDVAYGCPKNFSLNYKCGSTSKTENMGGETWGQSADINCETEFNGCLSILIMTDEGYIYICKIKDATITNNNFAKINDNATIFYTWDFSDKIDQPNASLTNRTNFITIGAVLTPDLYICSPNKKLVMTCDPTTIELVILTYTENNVQVNGINYGLGNTSAVYEITNLPPENNVGKVAWVNAMGLRKEYTSDLLEPSDDYDVYPGYLSNGNDIYQATMSAEDGEQWCNNNPDCAGFQYTNNICYFKNSEMYPKGLRQPSLGASELYVRKSKIKTNYEYEIIQDTDSMGYDIYSATMSADDGQEWCNNNEDCAGFTYYNGVCYFKNNQMYPNGASETLLGGQLYIKKDKIKSTCNTKLNNIDNLTWEHYIPDIFNGIYMTANYNCSNNLLNPNMGDYTDLNNNKDNLMTQLNNLDSSIVEETSSLINNTTSLNRENKFLYNSMKESFGNNTENQLNDITYLNTLLSNSKKFVIQKSYIIITLLVILLGLIIVLYKIKK
jgi:hypothetical protein